MFDNILLLLPLPGRDYPVGYLISAIFLIIAIVLFVLSIFMKDNSEDEYDDDYEKEYRKSEYDGREEDFDRYGRPDETAAANLDDTTELRNLISEISEKEDLETTRMFKPVSVIPEIGRPGEEEGEEGYDDTEDAEERASDDYTDEEGLSKETTLWNDGNSFIREPMNGTGDFEENDNAENEAGSDTDEERDEDASFEHQYIRDEESDYGEGQEEKEDELSYRKIDDNDEYEREEERSFVRKGRGPKRRKADDYEDEEDDEPKVSGKSGMSFADEVRRLIEEEERKNKEKNK